jgi:negative regulator of sigma-B (phosphoserine phosphatase)
MKLDVEYISKPMRGETANGDAVVIRKETSAGLLAVIDGLGHGPRAEHAAAIAVDVLKSVALSHDVEHMVKEVHSSLRGTRGAAALVCRVQASGSQAGALQMTGCGVGNVEIRCRESRLIIMITPGVLGGRTPRFRTFHGPLRDNERVAIFTDGISPRFRLADMRELTLGETCRTIFTQHRRSHDDATILVADLRS